MSDYTSYSDKVQVQLLLTDLGTERDVYLQLSFSGQNGESVTSVGSQSAIHLVGGVPTVMTMTDLHDYFSSLTGAYPYNNPTALAEGVYFICFKVYDQQTNALISKSGCANMLIAQNDPPFLVLPVNRDRIMEDASTANGMLQFQWTPRHIGLGIYQYKFKLARVQDTTISIQQYLTTYGPDYAVNDVNTPLLVLNSTSYPLIPGSTYVWQVQVYQLVGTDTVVNFKNDGNSEIWWFKYDTAGCTTPSAPAVIDIFKTSLKIVANGASKIKYKKLDNINWIEAPVPDNTDTMLLTNLIANTQYEIRSGSVCSEGYIYSSSTTATTLSDTSTTHELTCVIEADNQITNQTRTTTLVANNTFMAGKYKIYIDTITYNQGNSSFTGNGHVQVPYVYFANLKVKFENIGINTDNKLIDGQVITTWDPTMGNIADLNDIFGGGGHTGDVKTGDCKAESEVDFEITDASNITTKNITTDEDGIKTGDITISSGGKTATFSRIKLPTSIVDSKGTYYQVDENGNPKKIAETLNLTKDQLAQLKKISPTKQQPSSIFSAITGVTKYALDNYRTDYAYSLLWNAKYFNEEYPNYAITAKCMLPGKPDQIKVSLPNNWSAEDLKSVKFISTKGVKFVGEQVTKGSSDFTLNLLGGPADDAQLVMVAIEKGGVYETVAIIQLALYEQKTIKVAVVPVGSAALPSGITAANLQTELNNIYNPVGISVKIRVAEKFDNSTWDNGLKSEGSLAYTSLTTEMITLNNAYESLSLVKEDEACMFLVTKLLDATGASTSIAGMMPRAQKYGYLSAQQIAAATNVNAYVSKLIGHELAHGFFTLKHVFDVDYSYTENGALSDNLLDYPGGTKLGKFQWDIIHDPAVVLKFLEIDKKSQWRSLSDPKEVDAIKKLNTVSTTLNFLTPKGQKITLEKSKILGLYFENSMTTSNDLEKSFGYLAGFTLKGIDTVYYEYDLYKNTAKYYKEDENGNLIWTSPYNDLVTSTNSQNEAVIKIPYSDGYTFANVNFSAFVDGSTNTDIYYNFPLRIFENVAETDIKTGQETAKFKYYTREQDAKWLTQSLWDPDILSEMLDGHEKKVEHYFILKIAQLSTAYKELYKEFEVQWNDYLNGNYTVFKDATPALVPADGEPTATNERRLIFYKKKAAYFLKTIIDHKSNVTAELTKDVCAISKEYMNQVLNGSTSLDIYRLSLVNQINSMSYIELRDASIMSAEQRCAVLSVLNSGSTSEKFELAILKLIETIPDNQTDDFFAGLKKQPCFSIGNSNNSLIYNLINDINDVGFWGQGDNYKQLILNLTKLVYRSPKYLKQLVDNYSPSTNSFKLKNVKFYDYGFWERTRDLFGKEPFAFGVFQFNYKNNTEVVLTENNELQVTNVEYLSGFNQGPNDKLIITDIFEPIIIENNSDLSMLSGIPINSYTPLPAIMLAYMNQKGSNQFTSDVCELALDALLVYTGGGAIAKGLRGLVKLQKAARIADCTYGVLDISTSAFKPELKSNPKLKFALEGVKIACGFINVADLYANLKAKMNAGELVKYVNDAIVDDATQLQQVQAAIKAIYDKVDVLKSINYANTIGCADKLVLMAFVEKIRKDASIALAAGKNTAEYQKLINTCDVILDSKNGLGTLSQFLVSLGSVKSATSIGSALDKLVEQNWLTKTSSNNINTYYHGSTAMAHFASDGKLVMEAGTLSSISALPQDFTLSTSLENVTYNKLVNGVMVETTDDILIFENADKTLYRCIEGVNCFTAQTGILTVQGIVPIKDIKENMIVHSFNELTGKNTSNRVTHLFSREVKKLCRLVIDKDTIFATPEHVFYTSKKWIAAAALSVGMLMQTQEGTARVLEVKTIDTIARVYNFTVENSHTYFVGTERALVHNTNCKGKLQNVIVGMETNLQKAFLNTYHNEPTLLFKFINGDLSRDAYIILQKADLTKTPLVADIEALGKDLKKFSGLETKLKSGEYKVADWFNSINNNYSGLLFEVGSKYEYYNPKGNLLTWKKQTGISGNIQVAKELPVSFKNKGKIVEGKVGDYVIARKNVTGFQLEITRANRTQAGNLDVFTLDELIEVKTSIGDVSELQFDKYAVSTSEDFCNPLNKQVILYIDEPLGTLTPIQTKLLNSIKAKGNGVIVVNSLVELGTVLK